MKYNGLARIDLGAFKPLQKSMIPVCRTMDNRDRNGLECKVDTADRQRLIVEAFNDNAIFDIMDASSKAGAISRVMALSSPEEGFEGRDPSRIIYTVLDENPIYGLGGDPIKSALSGNRIKKALCAHGEILKVAKHDQSEIPVFVIEMFCGSVPVTAACRYVQISQEMRRIGPLLKKGAPVWAKISGFGEVANIRMNSRMIWKIYINNIQNFTFVESGVDLKFKKIDPDDINTKLKECSLLAFD